MLVLGSGSMREMERRVMREAPTVSFDHPELPDHPEKIKSDVSSITGNRFPSADAKIVSLFVR